MTLTLTRATAVLNQRASKHSPKENEKPNWESQVQAVRRFTKTDKFGILQLQWPHQKLRNRTPPVADTHAPGNLQVLRHFEPMWVSRYKLRGRSTRQQYLGHFPVFHTPAQRVTGTVNYGIRKPSHTGAQYCCMDWGENISVTVLERASHSESRRNSRLPGFKYSHPRRTCIHCVLRQNKVVAENRASQNPRHCFFVKISSSKMAQQNGRNASASSSAPLQQAFKPM